MIEVKEHNFTNCRTEEELAHRLVFMETRLGEALAGDPAANGGSGFGGAWTDACFAHHRKCASESWRFLHLMADCAIAMLKAWQAHHRGAPSIEFSLEGRPLAGPSGKLGYNSDAFSFSRAFGIGMALRRGDLLETLCAYPTKLLQNSPGQVDSYMMEWADALKAFCLGQSDWSKALKRAEKMSRAENLELSGPREAQVKRALFPLMTAIGSRDQEGFTTHLVGALEAHKALWGRGRNTECPEGLIALEASGLAAVGLEVGLEVRVVSGYLPEWLLVGNRLGGQLKQGGKAP